MGMETLLASNDEKVNGIIFTICYNGFMDMYLSNIDRFNRIVV